VLCILTRPVHACHSSGGWANGDVPSVGRQGVGFYLFLDSGGGRLWGFGGRKGRVGMKKGGGGDIF
jgi:hypothetical protein